MPSMSSLPPGPRLPPLQTWRFVRDGDALFTECARRYGDPFTVPMFFGTLVVTGSADGIKEIFTADPDIFASFGSTPLKPLVGANSMLLISGARHKRERKLLMPPFHGERMRAYGRLMGDIVRDRLGRCVPGRPVVMQELTQAVALDIILQAVFGIEEAEHIARFHRINQEVTEALHPAYMFFARLQTPWLPRWRRFLAAHGRMYALLQEQIDRRRKSGGDHEDILSLMLAARDDTGQPMSDDELRDELLTMVAAGHETTALSMAWALFWIHHNPAILARLQDELDGLGPELDPEALARLPYLGAVCDETLRLRPVATIAPRRLLAPLRLRGFELPEGTAVAASIMLAHNDPSVYPEPTRFRPERFLERRFTPFEYLPFGGGARRCLGAALAAYEMRIVLGSLLGRHTFSLLSSTVPRTIRRNVTQGPEGGVPMIYQGPRAQRAAAA